MRTPSRKYTFNRNALLFHRIRPLFALWLLQVQNATSLPYSSRSHTVLYIYLSNGQRESILRIVDLAGMQMIRSTASSKDGAEIRKTNIGLVALISILVFTSSLARVIRSLAAENASGAYMGFRDSKLTRLLQPCFDRSCFTQFLLCLRNSSSVKALVKE